MNSRKQGDLGSSFAILYFANQGYTVSIPISDSQKYDLVVEKNNCFYRIQTKTCFKKNKCGLYRVELRTISNTRGKNLNIQKISKETCDYVFIVNGDGIQYLIPINVISGKGILGLKKYKNFIVTNDLEKTWIDRFPQ